MICTWHCCQKNALENSLLCKQHIELTNLLSKIETPPKIPFVAREITIGERIALEAPFRTEKEVYPKTKVDGYWAGSANGELAFWRQKNSGVKK